MKLNWWTTVGMSVQKLCKGNTGHVSWRHLNSSSKTVRLPTSFSKERTVVSVTSGSHTSRIFVGLFKGKYVQKQPTFTSWTKTKLPRFYFECYDRNSI